MANLDLKLKIKEMGLFQWQVAEKYGISESQFCRMLRKELSTNDKRCILGAIQTLNEEKKNESKIAVNPVIVDKQVSKEQLRTLSRDEV